MTGWILLATAAQLLNAAVAIVDKYIVTHEQAMPKPFVYAFYTCLLSGMWLGVFALGLMPFPFFQSLGAPSLVYVNYPTFTVMALSMLSAYTFFAGLVSLYTALKEGDTSDVIPVVGAVSAIATFGLSYVFLDARLTPNFMTGIILLSVGTFLVSHLRFQWGTALVSVHAGLFFAAHYVVLKGLFDMTSFDNGFFWSRVAFIVVALSMLLVPGHYTRIHSQTKASTRRSGFLVLGNKLLAGIATLFILKATALSEASHLSVVQALGGLQFIFILLFSLIVGRSTHAAYGENVTKTEEIYHKVVFVSIITIGLVMLFA